MLSEGWEDEERGDNMLHEGQHLTEVGRKRFAGDVVTVIAGKENDWFYKQQQNHTGICKRRECKFINVILYAKGKNNNDS